MTSKGKHGNLIMRKYHERGEPCPVAVVAGMHPALFMIAGLEIPYGKNEYDAAGGLLGEAVEIINMPKTGLPVPANAEIAFEGFVHADDFVDEGPFGEWTGYYAGDRHPEPAIRVETLNVSRRPGADGRHTRRAAQRRHVLSRHLSLRRGVESARGGGRAGGQVASGRTRPAAAACGSPSRSSRCMAATPSRPG